MFYERFTVNIVSLAISSARDALPEQMAFTKSLCSLRLHLNLNKSVTRRDVQSYLLSNYLVLLL